jgi:hypothetical protein
MADDNDWVEELLRADRAAPVRDNGFAARTVARLPSRERLLTWITPVMTGIGATLAFLTIGGLSPPVSAFQQIELGGVLPLFLLLAGGIVLAGCAWAISEAR